MSEELMSDTMIDGEESHIGIFVNKSKEIKNFSYYEYKYLVSHENYAKVKSVLDEFCGGLDPFPSGIVDSIYYDSINETLLSQCMNGEEFKVKCRIRGYGNGEYNQVHLKMKHLSGVSKYKAKIKICRAPREAVPMWSDLLPAEPHCSQFEQIMYRSRKFGLLYPSVRIQYYRYRYRLYDYRITFDTNIEAFAPINGLPRKMGYMPFPYHVLELKTTQVNPKLPFVGLVKLPQVSFSKFMLGLQFLNS